jgi:3-methylfumaryl-CoA hydratase
MNLEDWIGRTESTDDVATAVPYSELSATLDWPSERPAAGTPLPALWHWLFFLPLHRQTELGDDGHARRGGFLPPVALPRRMWAGSQLSFHRPLRIGDGLRRTSTIANVTQKSGRTGTLVFVKVRHEIARLGDDGPAITEFHDIVYRDAPRPGDPAPAPQPAPRDEAWVRDIDADPVMLFRYSAVTFNGHRIHYDRTYVTGVEGYPGLVVHGPLIATLLLDLLRRERPEATVRSFQFRALRPIFDIHRFQVCGAPQPDGRTIRLWARDHDGWLAMEASAEIG